MTASTRPKLIAGPIVRRVDDRAATVWLAFDAAATVTLTVFDGDRIAAAGARATIASGAEAPLHVVAVSARAPEEDRLRWGARYTYAITVGGEELDLARFAIEGARPSFHLLSDDLSRLRFVHASCRKPHGVGGDALELVDRLLREPNPPQALFLTGDQIYADDVSELVLGKVATGKHSDRGGLVKKLGFTSGEAARHLIDYDEYEKMYVYAWTGSAVVQRVLANVATWMIFDDHDVTDDWRLDLPWVTRVKANGGGAIEQRALDAYALFQHWGNEPEKDPRGHASSGWGWSFETPIFRCVALDTRTRRDYDSLPDRSGLMSQENMDELRRQGEAHPKAFTIVISPAPVLGQRLLEGLQAVAKRLGSDNYKFDQEAWAGHPPAHQYLLEVLARLERVLILSGDVHFGFLARVAAEDQKFQIVNATSSPIKNEAGMARVLSWLSNIVARTSLQSLSADDATLRIAGQRVVEEIAGPEDGGVTTLQARHHRTSKMVVSNHVGDIHFDAGFVEQQFVCMPEGRSVVHKARFEVDRGLEAKRVVLQSHRAPAREPTPSEAVEESFRTGPRPSADELFALLSILRSVNDFREMEAVARIATENGVRDARISVLHGQALIELKRITAAISVLLRAQDSFGAIEGERRGLLGRAYKQLWIDAAPNKEEPRLPDLETAIRWYEHALRVHPDREWFVVNIMALHAARARFIDASSTEEAKQIARGLLDGEPDPKNVWSRANRGEAAMIAGDFAQAKQLFKAYLESASVTAFHARGTLRQLRELHGLTIDDDRGAELIPLFESAILNKGGTGELIDVSPRRAAALAQIDVQGVFFPLALLRRGLDRARSVARIETVEGTVGTAFLVDLSCVRPAWKAVLLTNAHVCSSPPASSFARPEEVRARFDASISADARPLRQLWTSPVAELDVTVLAIEGDALPCEALEPSSKAPQLEQRTFVNVIGHPEGMDAQVSAQDNELQKIDARYLWYRAGTAPGSSGSPVFDAAWDLIGVHRARNHTLKMNEGVRLDAIIAALR